MRPGNFKSSLSVGVTGQKKLYFSEKKSERGPHWSNKTFMLVKKTFIGPIEVYRELACPAQVELAPSAGGIGQK